jgi:hypothetical protein
VERLDRWSGLFWFGIAVAVCVHSVNLGVGSFRDPGIGFIFFWCGVVLGMLSLVLQIKTCLDKKKGSPEIQRGPVLNVRWSKVGTILFVLVVYALIFEWVGALLSTALLIAFLMRAIEAKKWYIVASVALVSAISVYVLFKVLLNVRLPAGLLGF